MSQLSAALWLLGLFAAAPALHTGLRYDFTDRLRDALILGVTIPFVLGYAHLLYPLSCWCALAIAIAVAYARGFGRATPSHDSGQRLPVILIGALIAVAWPQLMRPLLDGDSLSYHLPNAASWVQAHSVWTTATRYWWYPPASELFASALYATSGAFALPWCGFGALALLGSRIVVWARDAYGCPAPFADALAAAAVTAYPLAIQGGTLQNDVWLAAFFAETLWLLRLKVRGSGAARTVAVLALIKPQGWLLALIALITGGASLWLCLTTGAAFALWIARDGLLWSSAPAATASTTYANIAGSTILAHGAPALVTFARVALGESPFAFFAIVTALVAPAIARREPRLAWAACAAALLFFLLPFGYATSVPQLATGASLRFAAPAVAAGAIVFGLLARRVATYATLLLLASTLYGVWYVLAIFWNDGGTHVALPLAVLGTALAALLPKRVLGFAGAAAFGLAVVATTHLAARHPLDYYNDSLRVDGNASGIYRWIATTRPTAVGGWGLRLGVVNVLSPSTRTVDLSDTEACEQALRDRVVLVAVAQSDLPTEANAERLQAARSCGAVRFDDGIAVVAAPAITR